MVWLGKGPGVVGFWQVLGPGLFLGAILVYTNISETARSIMLCCTDCIPPGIIVKDTEKALAGYSNQKGESHVSDFQKMVLAACGSGPRSIPDQLARML